MASTATTFAVRMSTTSATPTIASSREVRVHAIDANDHGNITCEQSSRAGKSDRRLAVRSAASAQLDAWSTADPGFASAAAAATAVAASSAAADASPAAKQVRSLPPGSAAAKQVARAAVAAAAALSLSLCTVATTPAEAAAAAPGAAATAEQNFAAIESLAHHGEPSYAASALLSAQSNLQADVADSAVDTATLKERTQETINESFAKKDGEDLSMMDLEGATFMEASLRGADLHGSNLRGAMFTKAVLYRANLSAADLSDALIDRAVLNDADLRDAVLQGAWLALTDLGGADITGADFTDAIVDKFQLKQLCQRASGVNSRTGVATADSLRCGSVRFYQGSGSSR